MIEFALCLSFLTPLLLGAFSIGMNLGRNLQVTQLARNVGHMYVRWVDFSLPSTQDMVVRLAQGLNVQRSGGDGVVILSQVMVPSDTDCTGAGLTGSACVNRGIPVIVHRVAFGNLSLRSSVFGTPPANLIDSGGGISPNNYLTQSAARASNWGTVMTLASGEVAYVAEVYVQSPSWNVGGPLGSDGVYARAIY